MHDHRHGHTAVAIDHHILLTFNVDQINVSNLAIQNIITMSVNAVDESMHHACTFSS